MVARSVRDAEVGGSSPPTPTSFDFLYILYDNTLMIGPLIGIGGIAYILVLAELLRIAKVVPHAEMLRKFVHILTGTFAATWAFFMPFRAIQLLSLTLFAVVVVSKRLSIFKSVHEVNRLTYGEELFPVGIFITASLANSEWVYMAAVLHLGLADGFAAALGMWRGKRFRFKVWGQKKSLLGSTTFYLLSLAIIAATLWLDPVHAQSMSLLILLWVPIAATVIESIAIYGTDNVLVPLLVVASLNTLKSMG